MNAKKKKNDNIDNLSPLFDIEEIIQKPLSQSPPSSARENQALKLINYLELERQRLSKLHDFLDTPLDVQADSQHIENLTKETNIEVLSTKDEIVDRLLPKTSPLFKNIDYFWKKTFS